MFCPLSRPRPQSWPHPVLASFITYLGRVNTKSCCYIHVKFSMTCWPQRQMFCRLSHPRPQSWLTQHTQLSLVDTQSCCCYEVTWSLTESVSLTKRHCVCKTWGILVTVLCVLTCWPQGTLSFVWSSASVLTTHSAGLVYHVPRPCKHKQLLVYPWVMKSTLSQCRWQNVIVS